MPDIIRNMADSVTSCTITGIPEPNKRPKYTNFERGRSGIPEKPSET